MSATKANHSVSTGNHTINVIKGHTTVRGLCSYLAQKL